MQARLLVVRRRTASWLCTGFDRCVTSADARRDSRRMEIHDDPNWRDRFALTSAALTSSERNTLARAASLGRLVRVSRGAYVAPLPATPRSRDLAYRDLVHARHLVALSPTVFSHASAASLWRIPRIGPWPDRIHALEVAGGGRSAPGLLHHASGQVDSSDLIDGVAVTSLSRTILDLARTESMTDAVVATDAALAGLHLGGRTFRVERQQLLRELEKVGSGRGVRVAKFAIDFSDSESESPGETLSRLSIERAGLTRPVLQRRFDDDQGRMFVDFWWPDVGVAGEFDGMGKYLRSEWTKGRSTAEVVLDEKAREDRLRRQVSRVARWGWDVAGSPSRLGALLRAAGVR